MAKSVDDRGRGARMARRDEGAYCLYVTEAQRSQSGWIGREGDRLSHSRALRVDVRTIAPPRDAQSIRRALSPVAGAGAKFQAARRGATPRGDRRKLGAAD